MGVDKIQMAGSQLTPAAALRTLSNQVKGTSDSVVAVETPAVLFCSSVASMRALVTFSNASLRLCLGMALNFSADSAPLWMRGPERERT